MAYQKKIEDLVGKHMAEYQMELSTAKQAKELINKTPSMPYGYPASVYHPMHICVVPQIKDFVKKTGGKLSNGVPWVLSSEFAGNYLLGVYNHGDVLSHA